ncbi:pyrimidine reductase family protein [Glaciihabitans sp. UYNi722]|uniref:pyrimidine reductase family protein n=1 Tax=Glaciihabitans sp. UYNi722 TaxID=3156344 RepID=UPI0033961989
MAAQIDSLWPAVDADLSDDALAASLLRGDRTEPWLRVNFVSSVDGAATHGGLSGGLGGDADKRFFDVLRRLCDVVLVGAGTVRGEGYGPMRLEEAAAQWRIAAGLPQHPVFAIVSGRLDLDAASPIFTDAPVRPVVVTTSESPAEKRRALAEVADVIVAGDDALDVSAMLSVLHEHGLTQVHCEGGPSLFGSLLAADAVDELCLTVSPQLEAGDARRIASGELPESRGLELARVLRSEATLLLGYTRRR